MQISLIRNSSKLESFTSLTFKLQEVANLGCSFTRCKLFTLFMFVYDKNKDTPLSIGSMVNSKRISDYLPNQSKISSYTSSLWLILTIGSRSEPALQNNRMCYKKQKVGREKSEQEAWEQGLSHPCSVTRRPVNILYTSDSFVSCVAWSVSTQDLHVTNMHIKDRHR